jgi:hypothetical protein
MWMMLAALAWPAFGCGEEDELDRLVSALEHAQGTAHSGRISVKADTEADGRFQMSGRFRMDDEGRTRLRAIYIQDGEEVHMEVLQHERVAWIRSPQLISLLPRGKSWIRTTDPEVMGGPAIRPETFGEIIEAAGEVEELGQERVRGVEADHLRGTVDLRRAAELSTSSSSRDFLRDLGGRDASLPVDVWIGPEERPVRYRVEVRVPRPGGGGEQYALLGFEVFEYGVKVDTRPPPAAEVTSDSALQ